MTAASARLKSDVTAFIEEGGTLFIVEPAQI
jgi:hypothetical protein